jgi:5'-3' exonuclease
MVCDKLISYIDIIKPTKNIIIAFDGVAPVAKMEQQRTRRFKTNFEKKIMKNINPTNEHFWDKTCITPGTNFMNKLNKQIKSFFNKQNLNVENIIISGSDIPGEGEHKLFDYIKNNKIKHFSTSTVIYGLDADLIMLAINHLPISKKIYLFRETPEFIKSIDKSLDPNEIYIMDIPQLSFYITQEMNSINTTNIQTFKKNIRIHDYIFICFMLGNDFLPHFPSLNIRTNGISYILNAYKNTIGNTNHFLTNGNNINWKQFKKFISFLANKEHDFIKKEYYIRQKKQNKIISSNKDDLQYKYLLTPIYNRTKELYINPYEKYWEKRYYKVLFDIEPTFQNIKKICINYLEGLEWTIKYYTIGCPDWHWKYNYHYPPLLSDLLKFIPVFNSQMIPENNNKPIHPYEQLVYVLPKDSIQLLPKKIYNLINLYLSHHYPNNPQLQWEFCTYIWESHVKLPHISIWDIKDVLSM